MRRSFGLTRTIALSPSLTKYKFDLACATYFAASRGSEYSLISSGAMSPIVSGALDGASRQQQIFHVFLDDEALLLREIDSARKRRNCRVLLLLR